MLIKYIISALTLDVGDALLKDLLENLGVLELLLDLADDGLGKFALLALLNLALIAHPGVKDLLSLSSQSGALLELKGFSLELGGFLNNIVNGLLIMAPTKA